MMESAADFPWNWENVTETTLVKTGGGALHTIAVNYCVQNTVTIYDGVDAGGRVMGIIQTTVSQPVTMTYDAKIETGIYITVAGEGATDLTVNFI